jgi:molecular chaperone DnaK
MASFIGIDLGTTYSAVSYIDDTGRSKIVHNSEGSNITPSCIDFADGKAVVGEGARRSLGSDTVVAEFMQDMGTSKTYNIEGNEYTPTDCSAIVLKKLLQDTKAAIGEVGEAVVTIPANFANEARNATMNAAKQAGLDIKYIINEPTAAALYYAFQSGDGLHGYYAVYDLGGGTFDVTILKVEGRDVEMVTSGGITRLGGDDFDTVLQQIVQKKYKEKNGEDPEEGDYTKTNAEDDKKSLSKRDKVNARVVRTNIKVTREEFEQEISSLVAQTEMLCESIIDEAGIKVSDIQEVFLAGGSTRMPVVLESIRRVFKKDPVASVNVDKVVALGASLYAAYKGDQSKLSKTQQNYIKRIRVAEVTQKYLGMIEKRDGKDVVVILINKNEKIPCSVTRSYFTEYDNQRTFAISITEASDSTDDPRFVNVKAIQELPLPANRPAGQEIEITYSFDDSQIVHVSYVVVGVGSAVSVTTSIEGDSNNIDKFTVDDGLCSTKIPSKIDKFLVD